MDFDLDPKRASLEESSSPSPLFRLNLPMLDGGASTAGVKESDKLESWAQQARSRRKSKNGLREQ